jgi:2OG-Fe(II) oxygenase superfamily
MILSSSEKLSKSKLELNANTILVIDDFHLEEDYKELLRHADDASYTNGWKSNKRTDPHGHWNRNYVDGVRSGSANLAEVSGNIPQLQKRIWEAVKSNYHLNDMVLLRCYMNAHTYGVDGYIHTDSHRDDEWTVVTYLNEVWDPNWAGETILVDENNEIIKSILPKRNRAIIFPGKMKHAARGVSRLCFDLRRTFMFKFRAKRDDNFEKLSNFLISVGANKHKHSRGSLHDHLVRNYTILKDKGCDLDLCFAAGLHSIFGTNAFSKSVLEHSQSEIVRDTFGEKAESLALMFGMIERPKTLETPEDIDDTRAMVLMRSGEAHPISLEMLKNLRIMECANLIDQKGLKPEKHKNLIDLWENL